MINFIESIHDFQINRLMDSAIHLYLITLPELLPSSCHCPNVVKARAVIFVSFYCFRNPLRIQEQNRWCTGGRVALQPSRGFRGISSPEGLRYSTVPLTAAPSCVGRPCRLRGTQQTGSTSVIGKPVYAGGPLRAGAGDGRDGGALPHTPASPENSFRLFEGLKNIYTNLRKED